MEHTLIFVYNSLFVDEILQILRKTLLKNENDENERLKKAKAFMSRLASLTSQAAGFTDKKYEQLQRTSKIKTLPIGRGLMLASLSI